MTDEPLDLLVVGAGQAGLAIGHALRDSAVCLQLVDAHPRVGDSWRERFDSLVLFTPRAFSALPGMPVAGDPDGYAGKDEIADYLEAYATRFGLPVRGSTRIVSLRASEGRFTADIEGGAALDARVVVIATGAFQRPRVPRLAADLSPDVRQLTAADYRNPEALPSGDVIVVGDGATGRQIALELVRTHGVTLSTGRARRALPERLLGRSIFWWSDRLGLLRASRESWLARRMRTADPFPGRALSLARLRAQDMRIVGRLERADGHVLRFARGTEARADTVIWATGYRDDASWMQVPGVVDQAGTFSHRRGVSSVPGLFFIGRDWQWTRGSALLTGVGADAAYIAGRILRHLAHSVTDGT